MATTGKYRYTQTDQVLSTSYITFTFKKPIRAGQIKNLGYGGSIGTPKTTGSNIDVRLRDDAGDETNFVVAPGKGYRFSHRLITSIAMKRDGVTTSNYALESFRG